MGPNGGELETELTKRWKKKLRSNSELRRKVRDHASCLLSGVQLFVEEKQSRLVERIVEDAALVPIAREKPVYVS